MGRVLLIEDEPAIRLSLGRFLKRHAYEIAEATTCSAGESSFLQRRPDVVICESQLPDGNALEILARLRRADSSVPILVLSDHASIELAVRALKEGVEQFLTKPVDLDALLALLDRLTREKRRREAQRAIAEREARSAGDPFIGTSAAILELRQQALRLAAGDGPVLVLGEAGSGKGVLSRWIHAQGPRAAEPFVELNCAGLSRELLENDLFGHEQEAPTDAQKARPGLLEIADKGTLSLEEIGEVDLQVQPRLFKVLEEKTFRRSGDVRDRTVDVRLVAATQHDLASAVREKKFRSDLFYRIGVLPVRIPPLRERREDVSPLARALLPAGVELSREAEAALEAYPWPGNIRELRNVLERARVLTSRKVLEPSDLRLERNEPADLTANSASLDEVERRHIERVFRREKGKVLRTASVLGISRSSLYDRLQRYGIKIPDSED